MPIYIHSNGQQSGPFDEADVRERLRSGQLSPDDMGIPAGGTDWQKLGAMFPDAVASVSIPPPAAAANVAATPAKSKGGCLKAGLLTLGVVCLLLGILAAAGSRFIPSVSCDMAEQDHERIVKLQSDLDKATKNGESDKIPALQLALKQELSGAEASQRNCNEDKFRNNVIAGAGAAVAFVGLLMSVIGLFVGRKK